MNDKSIGFGSTSKSADMTRRTFGATVGALGLSRLSTGLAAAEPDLQRAPRFGAEESPTLTLARFAATFPADDIPQPILDQFGTLLLDNVASMLAGVVQPVHASARTAMEQATDGGAFSAVGGARLPFSTAVFLDGVAAGGFEFEHVIDTSHPSSTVFPAVLALAAREHCSGRDFMTAMILGYEVAARVGIASTSRVESERGFHNPGLNGTLGSAAACARLLKLDADTTASAIGLAASSSAGLLAFANTGDMSKRLHPARSAQLGLECTLMARAGILGTLNVIENPLGFLHAFSPAPELASMTAGLGSAWHGAKMIIKLAPVHAYALGLVYAVNAYRQGGESFAASDVGDVKVVASPALLDPSHLNPEPDTLMAAQYSLPFGLAMALARDLRNPLAVNDKAVHDEQIRAISNRIRFTHANGDPKSISETMQVAIRGKTVILNADAYPGLPGHPNYRAATIEKFQRTMVALKITVAADVLMQSVERIDAMTDTGELRGAVAQTAGRIVA